MNIDRGQLQAAVDRGIISEAQAEALWSHLQAEGRDRPRFSLTHVLYYLGGLVAIGGISVYVTLAWELLGGVGLLLVGLAAMAAGYWLTQYFAEAQKLPIPAGLMAALAVAAAPLAVYGLQRALGYWEGSATYRDYHVLIDRRWIVMELVTLAAGAAMLWRFRLPFLLMPVAFTLWYLSMDLAPLLYRLDPNVPGLAYEEQARRYEGLLKVRQWVSVVVGLAIMAGAIAVDIANRSRLDYAFWLHLAGVAAFWGGLSSMSSGSELGKLLYFLINLAMVLLGAGLGRRVYTVFGAFGVAGYLGYLAHRVFKESLLFPLALTLIGLGVVWLGVLWQRHEAAINAAIRSRLPGPLRDLADRQQG